MDELILEPEQKSKPSFEDFRHENGIVFWWASDFMAMLGYENMTAFRKVIDRATNAFISLGVKHYENIIAVSRDIEDKKIEDFKLTRFACYLVAMNGDPKKTRVAQAQAYFVEQTRKFEVYVQGAEDIDRIMYREEVRQGNKSLASVAKVAQITDYQKFMNSGYMGMYNMGVWQLKEKRGLPNDSKIQVYDYMGRTELAANLFRLTQTEERLKREGIKGQIKAEEAHYNVARQVRVFVNENTGKFPEDLPVERRLPDVKRELKRGMKYLAGIDGKKKSSSKKVK
ncbi:MAG: BRO family protein [Patescibacteria group bacterium]